MAVPVRGSLVLLAVLVSACVVSTGTIREVGTDLESGTEVLSPVRAFLLDGSTVLFRDGVTVVSGGLSGAGVRYPLDLADSVSTTRVPLDSIVGIEAFRDEVDGASSAALSVLAGAGVLVGGVALFKALFGSCPTLYRFDEEGEVLEAEAFSYSIAPLLEGRDLDLLGVEARAGVVSLELRNEALETHYINYLELQVVDHPAGAVVAPDVDGTVRVMANVESVPSVVGRDGRDVTPIVRSTDDDHYATEPAQIAAATPEDFLDHVEFRLPTEGADSVALLLTVRNSLLNTVLFYDFMLGRQGAAALDWLGRDVHRISTVAELGSWYRRVMGLRVEVRQDDGWQEVGRVPDTGPIAWETVVVMVPTATRADVDVRLSFMADAWRIDRIAVGLDPTVARVRSVPVSRLQLPDAWRRSATESLRALAGPDEDYLVTVPGNAIGLEFDVGAAAAGDARTFLLATQGYYTEWIRPDWIRATTTPVPFRPDSDMIPDLMRDWLAVRDGMEADFFSSRIPVR